MPESLWVARLIISRATAAKLSSQHHLKADDVRDAIVCVRGLQYAWQDDPDRGRRALVQAAIDDHRVLIVLYPVGDPMGDVYALGSAYVR